MDVLSARFTCCISLLLFCGASFAANIRLQLEGLSDPLKKNVRIQLSGINSDEVTADSRFQARVSRAVRDGLAALGYYQPQITFQLLPPPERGRQVLKVTVVPGKPVHIAGVDVRLQGGARQDSDFQLLLTTTPPIGSVLHHGDYEAFKKKLSSLALNKGYFDGEFTKNQLGIARNLYQAYWDIDYDSGSRYRFGKVNFVGSQINSVYLQHLLPFRTGDDYQADKLSELNRRLLAVDWFNSVVVVPRLAQARQDKMLPVEVVVSSRSKNNIETGIGYSTDVGPRLKLSWRKPWINQYGQSFTANTSISKPEQQLDFTYKIPLLKNPLEQYYQVQGGFKRTDLNDTKANSSTVVVSRFWDLSSGWQRAINLRWSTDHFTQANNSHTTQLIYPGVMISRTRSRGGLMSDWGDTQRYSLDYSSTLWGSGVDFLVLQAQNVWLRSIGEHHRFIVRGHLGWIETNQFTKLPPDLRFFAGGDRSIRGYKYKSISPKNAAGQQTGASKLISGSLEYQYNVSGKWWGAVFVDGGEAVNKLSQSDFKTGAGMGVRWMSPVGPVKLDIAVPVGDKTTKGVQFYVGLGPEL